MSIFQSASRQVAKPHLHAVGDHCPLCEQPIAQDVVRRIEARQREQYEAALAKARADADAKSELEKAAFRAEAMQRAEATLNVKLEEFQAKLKQEEQAKAAMEEEIAELKAAQMVAIQKGIADREDGFQRQQEELRQKKDAEILAEKAKNLKLQSDLQDLQRKHERKSANELGEGSEIDLFEQLRNAFEGDRVWRVGKGVNGADVIHEVIHNGKVCGKIVYDAKNRNAWQNEFVTKLRADKIAQAADHAILSSNKFPKDTAHVHYQDGVIIASPARVLAIVQLLRDQVVRMHELRISKEGREQKSVELYAFITSEHCKALLDQVETQAGRMLELDSKEQEAHRRLWDARKKLINSVQKARSDLVFEIDRIIGTAGNGPEDAAA